MTATLNAALEKAAGCSSRGIVLVDREERESWLPWSDVAARGREVAGRLAALGIRRGDRVALVFPTGEGFLSAFFGTVAAGGVPVPLYPPVRLGRLDEYHRRTAAMVVAAGARLVLADARVRRILGEAMALARPELGCRTLRDLPAGPPLLSSVDPDDLALVQFSSGTTVEPKPVALTHRAVMSQAAILNGFWPDDATVEHRGACWLPLYHDMGLIGCVFPALERPATLALLPPEAFVARPALWLRAIARHRATVSPAPNFAYALATARIKDDEMEGLDLSSWKVALCGAETVSPRVLEQFGQRFARWGFDPVALTPVYGLSEASLAVTFSRLDAPPVVRRFRREPLAARGVAERASDAEEGREIVSVGRPLPGFEIEVRGEEDTLLPPGRVGRIWARGPSLMRGYLGREADTRAALKDGWLDTGDLGFLAEDELHLVGRAKDVLILRGRNHAPEEVELAAWSVPGARTGCAVAVSHMPEGGSSEELIVLVERGRDTGSRGDASIVDACRQAVLAATGLLAARVELLEPGTLLRTSSGKLRRQESVRRFLAGELEVPAAVTPLRMAGALARSQLAFARAAVGKGRSRESR